MLALQRAPSQGVHDSVVWMSCHPSMSRTDILIELLDRLTNFSFWKSPLALKHPYALKELLAHKNLVHTYSHTLAHRS